MTNDVFTQKERNAITLLIIIFLSIILFFAVRGIIEAILGSFVLYTIFRPWNHYLIEKWKFKRPLSAVILIIFSFLIIVLPLVGIGSMLVRKITQILENPEWINNVVDEINRFAGEKLDQPDLLKEELSNASAYIGGIATSVAGGAAELFLEITVMYFLLYFMFAHNLSFERGLLRYSPFKVGNAVKFGNELRNITYSNVVGQTFIAIVQGGCLSFGIWMFGFPDALFWGVICAVLAFIPLLGPPLIFVPIAVWGFVEGNNWQAIGLLIYGFVFVINIDNVLRLIIAKKVGDIHPIITVVGVIIGIPLFGVMGLVYGPLLLAYFLICVRIYEANKRAGLEEEIIVESPKVADIPCDEEEIEVQVEITTEEQDKKEN